MSGTNHENAYNSVWFFTEVAQKLGHVSADHLPVGILMGTSITYDAANNASTPEHAVYSY